MDQPLLVSVIIFCRMQCVLYVQIFSVQYTASNNGTDPSPVSAGHAVTRCYVARGPTALPRTSLSVFDLHFYPPLSLSVYLSSQDQRDRERERERERERKFR